MEDTLLMAVVDIVLLICEGICDFGRRPLSRPQDRDATNIIIADLRTMAIRLARLFLHGPLEPDWGCVASVAAMFLLFVLGLVELCTQQNPLFAICLCCYLCVHVQCEHLLVLVALVVCFIYKAGQKPFSIITLDYALC